MIFHVTRLWFVACLGLAWVGLVVPCSQAQVSVNLALDDPAYALLDKLVNSHLTFTNALTIKPITRLYAAHLIAEAIERRRHELETEQRQAPFLDDILEVLATRFKRELQQVGFIYQPRRSESVVFAPLVDLKLDTVFAKDPFVHRDGSGLTPNLQGVFGLQEGFVPGRNVSLRARSVSWAVLWDYAAAYLEPEVIVRSHPLLGDTFEAGIHKGYVKGGWRNLEVAFGRDTLWWGPASQGDVVLSNNAPPLTLVKVSTPRPWRIPWEYGELGEWQIAYFAARLEADRDFPQALLSGLRVAFQPASYVKFGYTNAFMAFGRGGVDVRAEEYLHKLFVPTLDTAERTVNGLVAYDVVLSVPWVRALPLLAGLKLYWQRGQDHGQKMQGLLGGGNILGGVLEGGRWDIRLEYTETRDRGTPWYTHPTYTSGFAFQQFFLGHPIGGAAQSLFGRATYYFSPTAWIAADGRREQYSLGLSTGETTQQRFGLEGSYEFPWGQRLLTLQGRVDYAALTEPTDTLRAFNIQLMTRWHF